VTFADYYVGISWQSQWGLIEYLLIADMTGDELLLLSNHIEKI
jgi:hypothetical protein